jgi:ribosomal protein S8
MDIITKEEFDKADKLPIIRKPINPDTLVELTDEKIAQMMQQMKNPVESQKEMAIRIKMYLEMQIDKELKETGYLSDNIRKWMKEYNEILDRIQKATHGDKSVNLHLHEVRHSHIATKIRQSINENEKSNNN